MFKAILLLFILMNAVNTNANTKTKNTGDIMFIEPVSEPQCNKNKLFCSKVENYPSIRVEALIEADLNRYMELFGEDVLIKDFPTRFDEPNENSLCRSSERVIFPQSGLNRDDKTVFIINHKNLTQGIRVEECLGINEKCQMTDNFPNGYTARCKQNYAYRQLLALTDDGKILKDLFKIPSSCKCVLQMRDTV